jgi:hypothetical protein
MLMGGKTLLRPLGQHRLEPGGFVDLGEIVLEPPGTASFVAQPAGSLERVVEFVRLSSLSSAPSERTALPIDGWPGEVYPILAGDYRLALACGDLGTRTLEFSVRSGEHTQVVVER